MALRVVYMGKDKPSCVEGLRHLVARGVEVVAVVAPQAGGAVTYPERLAEVAAGLGIPLTTDDELYAALDGGETPAWWGDGSADAVFSFLFWKRIRRPLIAWPRLGCLNFHPAPLPDFRGVGGYNVAILEGAAEWGVSAHYVDEEFDTGEIVRVDRFAFDAGTATALSLDIDSQRRLLALFRDVADMLIDGRELPRASQGEGRYVTREQLEELRRVRAEDTPETAARRARAFWYPPYPGATTEAGGSAMTVVDERLLAEIGRLYAEREWEGFRDA